MMSFILRIKIFLLCWATGARFTIANISPLMPFGTKADSIDVLPLDPTFGPTSGGTVVLIKVHGKFHDRERLGCVFNETFVSGYWISGSKVECVAPPSNSTGEVMMKLVSDELSQYSEKVVELSYVYYDEVTLSSIHPESGIVQGGTRVTVSGHGFMNSTHLTCKFGTIPSAGIFLSQNHVSCRAPPSIAGSVHVSVSNNGIDFSVDAANFQYVQRPRVFSLTPNHGTLSGGTPITITGEKFEIDDHYQCKFDQVTLVNATRVDFRNLICIAPAWLSSINVPIDIVVNGNDSFYAGGFAFVTNPTITSFYPHFGPRNGGTIVLINGLNFNTRGKARCRFGGKDLEGRMITSTQMICRSPPWTNTIAKTEGNVSASVEISSNGVDYYKASKRFEYYENCHASIIVPIVGSLLGGTTVRLRGTNFMNTTSLSCRFGENIVSATYFNFSSISCVTPRQSFSGIERIVNVSVSNNGEDFDSSPLRYRFVQEPEIISVTPLFGSIDGNTKVVMRALHFDTSADFDCRFGENITARLIVTSNVEGYCLTPKVSEESKVLLSVGYHGTFHFSLNHRFIFHFLPRVSIKNAYPLSIPLYTKTSVFVEGGPFRNYPSLVCRFGTNSISASWHSEEKIECSITLSTPGMCELKISNDGLFFYENEIFVQGTHVDISGATPKRGNVGYKINVFGINFDAFSNLQCLFNNIPSDTFIQKNTYVGCVVPYGLVTGLTKLTLAVNGVRLNRTIDFVYDDSTAIIDHITPNFGFKSESINVNVSIYGGPTITNCKFGDDVVEATMIAGFSENVEGTPPRSYVSCKTPDLQRAGEVLVRVSSDGESFYRSGAYFVVIENPRLIDFWPKYGTEGKDGIIYIEGKNFHPHAEVSCEFLGNTSYTVSSEFVSSESVECAYPMMKPGAYEIKLCFENTCFLLEKQFQFYPMPKVITATMDRNETIVILKGKNFVARSPMICLFNENLPSPIKYVNPSYVICNLPIQYANEHIYVSIADNDTIIAGNVLVDRAKKLSSNAPNKEVMYRALLKEIYPKEISANIRTRVTVTGNFDNDIPIMDCKAGDYIFTAYIVSHAELVCIIDGNSLTPGIYNLKFSSHLNIAFEQSPVLKFNVLPDTIMHTMRPNLGRLAVGAKIKVEGENFLPSHDIMCIIGGEIGFAKYLNSTQVLCTVPYGLVTGLTKLTLAVNGIRLNRTIDFVYDDSTAIIDHITPNFGFKSESINVNVSIYGGPTITHCKFGDDVVEATMIAGFSENVEGTPPRNYVSCKTPDLQRAGEVLVRVSSDGESFYRSSTYFVVIENPRLIDFWPKYGTEGKDGIIYIKGKNFHPHAEVSCEFLGNTSYTVSSKFVSPESVECAYPVMYPGKYTFSLLANELSFRSDANYNFLVRKHPTFLRLYPSLGKMEGGTKVFVFGSGFYYTSSLACDFENVDIVEATFVNETLLYCTSPITTKLNVDVSLKIGFDGVTFLRTHLLFSYYTLPKLTGVHPNRGHFNSITHLTLSGSNFLTISNDAKCKLNTLLLPATIVSDKIAICTVSKSTLAYSTFPIQISLNSGVEWSLPNHAATFQYYAAPYISSVNPDFGSYLGGTIVNITGDNFVNSPDLSCRFGNKYSQKVIWISRTNVLCIAPETPPGKVIVQVTVNGVDYDAEQHFYNYVGKVRISSFFPPFGSTFGGTEVSIFGKNFISSENLVCTFGNKIVQAKFESNSFIKCISPTRYSSESDLDILSVSNIGFDGMVKGGLFKYRVLPSIVSIHPDVIYVGSKNEVHIITANTMLNDTIWCKFSSLSEEDHYIMKGDLRGKTVVCEAPVFFDAEAISVAVSANSVEWSSSNRTLSYVERPETFSMEPEYATTAGGIDVKFIGRRFHEQLRIRCLFGSVSVEARRFSSSDVRCQLPQYQMAVDIPVSLILDGYSQFSTNFIFRYLTPMIVRKIEPRRGSTNGGESVIIHGSNFVDVSGLSCIFGSIWVNAVYASSRSIVCNAPASKPGFHHVRVALLRQIQESEEEIIYETTPNVNVLEIKPTNGPERGGTPVAVFMSLPTPDDCNLFCNFGNIIVRATHDLNGTESIICQSPAKVGDVTVQFFVESSCGEVAKGDFSFSYFPHIHMRSISTKFFVISNKQQPLKILGENFVDTDGLCCIFDEKIVPAIWISSSTLICYITPLKFGSIELRVSNNFGVDVSTSNIIQVVPPIEVTNFHPKMAQVDGGAVITVHLRNLQNESNVECIFGTVRVRAVIFEGHVKCVSPVHKSGAFNFSVIADNNAARNSETFEFLETPAIASIQPLFGYTSSETPIGMKGSNLVLYDSCILKSEWWPFGLKVAATPESLTKSVRCIIPPLEDKRLGEIEIGLESVKFGLPRIMSDANFSYIEDPIIKEVIPPFGIEDGGTLVIILGLFSKTFSPSFCKFGDVIVRADFINETSVACFAPKQRVSTTALRISTNGISFPDSYFDFEYVTPSEILSMYPSAGPVEGGTNVFVSTNNAKQSPFMGCLFGSVFAPGKIVDINTLLCVSPPAMVDDRVKVSITFNGFDFSRDHLDFIYVPTPIVTNIIPRSGSKTGGTMVNISVSNYLLVKENVSVFCSFGGSLVEGIILDNTTVGCTSPPQPKKSKNRVRTSILYEHSVDSHIATGPYFTFSDGLNVTSVNPSMGSSRGGTNVHIEANLLEPSSKLSCNFVGVAVTPALYVGTNSLHCKSPPSKVIGDTRVEISSMDGQIFTSYSSAYFKFIDAHEVSWNYPKFGSFRGGTAVRVYGVGFFVEGSAHNSIFCRYGSHHFQIVPGKIISDECVECVSPRINNIMSPDEVYEIGISINFGHDFVSSKNVTFSYTDHLNIVSILPTLGPLDGGTPIKVFVQGLDPLVMDDIKCHFGNDLSVKATIQGTERDFITCISPKHHRGSVMLSLSVNNENDMSRSVVYFDFVNSPAVNGIHPNSIFGAKEEKISFYGRDFIDSSQLMCQFGNIPSIKVKFISSKEIICTISEVDTHEILNLKVKVSNNGIDFGLSIDGSNETALRVLPLPNVVSIHPSIISRDGGTVVHLIGKNLESVKYCRFGIFGEKSEVAIINHTASTCIAPRDSYEHVFRNESRVMTYISNGNDFIPVGISVIYEDGVTPEQIYESTLNESLSRPIITSIYPAHIFSDYQGYVTVSGSNFNNHRDTCCFLQDTRIVARYISSEKIVCKLTSFQSVGNWSLYTRNGGSSLVSSNQVMIELMPDPSLISINPTFGKISGGTLVKVKGTFNSLTNKSSLSCHFGDFEVEAELINDNKVYCISPPSEELLQKSVRVAIGYGGSYSLSSQWFHYLRAPQLLYVNPSFGNIQSETEVIFHGAQFFRSDNIKCRFGSTNPVKGSFISSTQIMCLSPYGTSAGKVRVGVSLNGQEYTNSNVEFEYKEPLIISTIWPNFGWSGQGHTLVNIHGQNFIESSIILCVFGSKSVPIKYVNASFVTCRSPPHSPGAVRFQLSKQMYFSSDSSLYASTFTYLEDSFVESFQPTSSLSFGGNPLFMKVRNLFSIGEVSCKFGEMVTVGRVVSKGIVLCSVPPNDGSMTMSLSVSLNGRDFSNPTNSKFVYIDNCREGVVCDLYGSLEFPAPNGTIRSAKFGTNFTLCPQGFFQPRSNRNKCLSCPLGYHCPDSGLSAPLICPAGYVCNEVGLLSPIVLCPKGHYCMTGTKTDSTNSFLNLDGWSMNEESGLVLFNASKFFLDTEKGERDKIGFRGSEHVESNLIAERPIPCPVGFYCRSGVSTNIHIKSNFSTPQKCFDGYFCPKGSFSPEGIGPCPTGLYCPSQTHAHKCPAGNFCPAVGNTRPRRCFPGTFNDEEGQSKCKLCGEGEICPGWGAIKPLICPAGFICSSRGLAFPILRCPPGYYCEEGTKTIDFLKDFPPKSCPPGVFCLGGVSHNVTIDWVPSEPLGATSPQLCTEGYFCAPTSSSRSGSGACFPGHYCPPGSAYPKQVPAGSFSSDRGAINPTLCFPGTYSPIKGSNICRVCPAGFTCKNYGTYVPRICRAGTYRSNADSITCKLCPLGTFSPFKGATDISQCLPCPSGQVCGKHGMTNLTESIKCPGGHVCGTGTSLLNQYEYPCPAGYMCSPGTKPEDQFKFTCLPGNICPRGTQYQTSQATLCPSGQYCPEGTSTKEQTLLHCPQQTNSNSGIDSMLGCVIDSVGVCDKKRIHEKAPLEDITYYPQHHYTALDGSSANLTFDSLSEYDSTGEVIALKKVIPLQVTQRSLGWENDTLEILHSCPSYTFSSAIDKISVIGRNFRNESTLSCRFRLCDKSYRSESSEAENRLLPGKCQSSDGRLTTFVSDIFLDSKATFLSSVRVLCPVPNDILVDHREEVTSSRACGRDSNGNAYFVQNCDDADFDLGICTESGNKRIYSLIVNCTEHEKFMDACENTPSAGKQFNPCITRQILIEISNDGNKFSSHGHENLLSIPQRSFSILTYANEETSLFDIQGKHPSLTEMEYSDSNFCNSFKYEYEAERPREEGWILLPFMHRAHLSFDFRGLPKTFELGSHFNIALFVRPSSCSVLSCDSKRNRIPDEELAPCDLPVDLPNWLLDPKFDKHQIINLTVLALDDVIIKPELHIIHGLFVSFSEFLTNTLTIYIDKPERSYSKNMFKDIVSTQGRDKRRLSPNVSWEEKLIHLHKFHGLKYSSTDGQYISEPLNLPPRWGRYEKGRILLGVNISQDNPTELNIGSTHRANFWSNPFPSSKIAKEASDKYSETFHGVNYQSGDLFTYNHQHIMLPYLPFFSKCREFDSHIPFWALVEDDTRCQLPKPSHHQGEDWWRRDIPPLPHQDDVVSVGPFDFGTFYPISDWCERRLYCEYEENLSEPDVNIRWFEANTGTSLFSIIRDPLSYFEYTGRSKTVVSKSDGGGQKWIQSVSSPDTFIPVRVDRTSADKYDGKCTELCFPRQMILRISFYQRNRFTKRIIDAVLEYQKFDKNPENREYEVDVQFYPLDYRELIIKFAFGRELFLLLFILIGVFTVFAAMCFWCIIRLTTKLESPPRLKLSARLWLSFPQALYGFILAIIPIIVLTSSVTYLLKGKSLTAAFESIGDASNTFKNIRRHYMDVKIDPSLAFETLQGRMGVSFIIIAFCSLIESTNLFVPERNIKSRRESTNFRIQLTSNWAPLLWKRSSLIYVSVTMALFLTTIVEWSYWRNFGYYIWEAIIALKFVNIIASYIVEKQLNETLLCVPIMTSMSMIQTLVTLSANDFMDFLLSYIVELGFLILERMYTDPSQVIIIEKIAIIWKQCSFYFQCMWQEWNKKIGISKLNHTLNIGSKGTEINEILPEKSETVEPILDSYGSYCCDTMSLLYTPYVIILLMAFRNEIGISSIYGIKEQDMEYYLLFALVIIPFQIIADVLIHGSQELFHGWKLYDYMMYSRYRFVHRELKWKGMEDTLDECIDENLRSIDQMCFSSQFYMVLTLHVNGLLYLVLGVQMMIRSNYNPFGDPLLIILVLYIGLSTIIVKRCSIFLGSCCNIWRTRHENTAWHSRLMSDSTAFNNVSTEINALSHDEYTMDQKITSDTFRHKFLSHNRSWLVEQLPTLLSPRTLSRGRPHLIGQLTKILNKLNQEISSDSSTDDAAVTNNFKSLIRLSAPTRRLLKWWLRKAQHRLKMREVVQPQLLRARGSFCEQCLSQKNLLVEPCIVIEEMYDRFQKAFPATNFNQVKWKHYWQKHQKYRTLCLDCKSREKEEENKDRIDKSFANLRGIEADRSSDWGAIYLNLDSEEMIRYWYTSAKTSLYGKNGRARNKTEIDISDDEEDDSIRLKWSRSTAPIDGHSKDIAVSWLRTARAQLQRDCHWPNEVKRRTRRSYLQSIRASLDSTIEKVTS